MFSIKSSTFGSARSIDISREASSLEQTHSVSLVTATASRRCHANSIVTGSHFSEIQAPLIKVNVRTSSSPGTVTRRVSFARDSSRAFRAVPSGYLMVIYYHFVDIVSARTSPRGSIALHGRYRTDRESIWYGIVVSREVFARNSEEEPDVSSDSAAPD